MGLTAICIWSLIINVVLLGILTWFVVTHFKLKMKIKGLVSELSNDSLEHYLAEIKKRGYEFTLKPKKNK